MTGTVVNPLRALIQAEVTNAFTVALQDANPTPPQPDPVLQQLVNNVGQIMVALSDIRSVLAANEASETKMITLLQTMSANNASLTTQLAAALASNDPVAMQAIITQMQADQATMDAAVTAATPPGTTAPGAPTIS